MLASWPKSLSPIDVLFNLTYGVISTTESLHSKLQTTGGEKDFLTPLFIQDRVFGFARWTKLVLS